MNVAKIILTRCQIFFLKCNKFNFGWDSALDRAGEAHIATPDPLAGFGEKGMGRRNGGKGKGTGKDRKEGRKGDGERVRGGVRVICS